MGVRISVYALIRYEDKDPTICKAGPEDIDTNVERWLFPRGI